MMHAPGGSKATRTEKIALFVAGELVVLGLLAAWLGWHRWSGARDHLAEENALPVPAVAPTDLATLHARIAAARARMPAAGSAAARALQQQVVELCQRQGMEISDVAAHGLDADVHLPGGPHGGGPGWPGGGLEIIGQAHFAEVASLLRHLGDLDGLVVPLELDIHGLDGPDTPDAGDGRLKVRLVLAL
jgi:hypothetical protein